jgi:hypothetical protein
MRTIPLLAAAAFIAVSFTPLAAADIQLPEIIGVGQLPDLGGLTKTDCPKPVVPWAECMLDPVLSEVFYLVGQGLVAVFYIVDGVYYAFETICNAVIGSCPVIVIGDLGRIITYDGGHNTVLLA